MHRTLTELVEQQDPNLLGANLGQVRRDSDLRSGSRGHEQTAHLFAFKHTCIDLYRQPKYGFQEVSLSVTSMFKDCVCVAQTWLVQNRVLQFGELRTLCLTSLDRYRRS